MGDYTQANDYSAKDGLPAGNANKKILGADLDTELDRISTAIATKAENATDETISGTWTFSKNIVLTKGDDISSASSITLGDGTYFDITGTTTITGIASKGIGSRVVLHFDGALILTHHATDLILPSAANITTVAGDIAEFYEYASADWRCISYTRAGGLGTGAKSLTANSVLLGNGTSDVQLIAPGSSGNVLTSNGSTWASAAAAGGGKVLQIVSATTDTQVDVNSTSFSDTGLTAAITPSATSSKVLVMVSQAVSHNSRSTGQLKILRAATSIFNHIDIGDNDNQRSYHFIPVLDSPSSTSALTYKTQMARHDQSGTINIQRNDDGETAKSTILLVEIGA